jgi:hypothetical protein
MSEEEGIHVAFWHCSRNEIMTGIIMEKSKNIEGIYLYKVAYFDGTRRMVCYIEPKFLIKAEA